MSLSLIVIRLKALQPIRQHPLPSSADASFMHMLCFLSCNQLPSHTLYRASNTKLANLPQHILHSRIKIATGILVACRSIEVPAEKHT